MIRSGLRLLAVTVVWGSLSGVLIGVINVATNDYIAHGLTRLATRVIADSARTYLLAALLGWIIVLVVRGAGYSIARLLHGLPRTILEELTGLGTLAAAVLPVWIWTILHDFWLYERSKSLIVIVFSVAGLAHLVLYFALIRRMIRTEQVRKHPRLVGVSSGVCAAIVIGLTATSSIQMRSVRAQHVEGTSRPNVLIILMDTVRADRWSCNGYERPTTPSIDALSQESIRYPNFYSTSCWTLPSHASLFTGLYPARHGATQEHLKLENNFPTLMEVLTDTGYRTWGASGNPLVSWSTNLTQGIRFSDYHDTWRASMRRRYTDGDKHPNNVAFERLLSGQDGDQPFFAFINYMDAHSPYVPDEPYLSQFLDADFDQDAALKLGKRSWSNYFMNEPYPETELNVLSDLYDAEVAYVDAQIGKLLTALREDGRYDNTLIIVTADHGEHLGENGLVDHVFGLYNTTVHIPLLIRLPAGIRGGEVDDRVGRLVDVLPTVLNACHVEHRSIKHHGHDLLDAELADESRVVLSEYYFPIQAFSFFSQKDLAENMDKVAGYLRRLQALQRGDEKCIWSSDNRHAYYDLSADPEETANLFDAESPSGAAESCLAALDETVALYSEGVDPGPLPDMESVAPGILDTADPEMLDELRSLGYVE